MKKMSQKQKNRNNVISAKRMAKNKRRKPHLKKIAEAIRKYLQFYENCAVFVRLENYFL